MQSNNNGQRNSGFLTRGFAAFWAALVFAVLLSAQPAEAWHFAYVTNSNNVSVIDTNTNTVIATVPAVGDGVAVTPDGNHVYVTGGFGSFSGNVSSGTVSVINTTTNTVVATIPIANAPFPAAVTVGAVAFTPDGKHAYVTYLAGHFFPGTSVAVIDTATNMVVARIGVGCCSQGVAVTPDGKHVYALASNGGNNGIVSVIDTATNTIVATISVPSVFPNGVALTPDGKHAYVVNVEATGSVSVIDTTSNSIVATIPVGTFPFGFVAITPDGNHAYVTNQGNAVTPGTVSVIDTATNTVVATVPFPQPNRPLGVAITADGKHAYVANNPETFPPTPSVSVINTASNTVVATVPVGGRPFGVATSPPVPFSALSAKLNIHFGHKPNKDAFGLRSEFTLGSASNGINLPAEPVTLQVGTFATTIPAGSFKGEGFGPFHFNGEIDGVDLKVLIKPTGAKRFAFDAKAHQADLTGTTNPVTVRLAIGDDTGTASVNAQSSGSEISSSE
jgi:YVTN family beta-propeller protein